MDQFIARANIDHYLDILKDGGLTPERRATIVKLLVAEEDKLAHDREQLEFAQSRAANGRYWLNDLRQRLDGMAEASTHRPMLERLVANFEITQELLDQFCERLQAKLNFQL